MSEISFSVEQLKLIIEALVEKIHYESNEECKEKIIRLMGLFVDELCDDI
ncbi:TPA: hypothetical protein ACS61N_004587 [Klebsiella oxytoca]